MNELYQLPMLNTGRTIKKKFYFYKSPKQFQKEKQVYLFHHQGGWRNIFQDFVAKWSREQSKTI